MPVYTATSLEQANASGAIGYAVSLLNMYPRAHARGELEDALLDAPPGLTTQILDEAQRRIRAGERMQALTSEQVLQDRQIPINPLLPSNCEYRYRVQLSWADPITGSPRGFDAAVCSPTKLTVEEAEAKGLEMASNAADDYSEQLGSIGLVGAEEITYHFVSVERRG